jgi:hypothetical protein
VTLGQRVLNKPLRMRLHYGHPDLFDKLAFMQVRHHYISTLQVESSRVARRLENLSSLLRLCWPLSVRVS